MHLLLYQKTHIYNDFIPELLVSYFRFDQGFILN